MSSPLGTTLTVWHALFLREALDRFFGSRAAWAWLIIEPGTHLLIMATVFAAMRGSRIGNVDFVMWICIGMLGFFLFRRTSVQTMHAVDCNKAFFAFRQVRPFDAALARGSVEGFSMFFVSVAILIPLAFWGKQIMPADPLMLIVGMSGLWLLGLGYGLITSAIQRLVPESGHIFQITMVPLYFISGAIMPIFFLPKPYRDWLFYNPIAHGLELCRAAFFGNYQLMPGISMTYLYIWVLILLALGLILYKLFETRLVMR